MARMIDATWLKCNLNKVFPRECDQLYGMLQLIDEAPALTPPNEPRAGLYGKWENVPANGVYDAICTNCGFHLGIRFYPSEYCPNCGAKMDKEGT